MTEIKTTIQLRHDSAENWANTEIAETGGNRVLKSGEFAVEYDENGKAKLKIGASDGKTAYKDLDYFASAEPANVFQVELSADETDVESAIDEVVSASGKELQAGDIAIVKAGIAGDKTSYTSYVYGENADGEMVWMATDGNYSAKNVYFDQDLLTTYQMGNIKLTNGQGTISAEGKNLVDVFNTIYVTETKTNLQNTTPSASVSATTDKYLLVGASSTAQTVTVGLNKGKYDYGYGYVTEKNETDIAEGTAAKTIVTNDGTGVEAVTYSLTNDGTTVAAIEGSPTKFSIPAISKDTAPSSQVVRGKVSYKNAGNPISNLNNIYPAQAYADGTTAEVSKTLNKWYYPMYHGFTYTDGTGKTELVADHTKITGARVQNLSTTIVDANAYDKVKTTSATAAKAWRQYFIAFPSTYGWAMTEPKDGNGIDCTPIKCNDVTLTFNNIDVVYTVYCINNAADYGTLGISWKLG